MIQEQINRNKERFRTIHQPLAEYEFTSDEEHCCWNCGHDFKGNYCPHCSQKAGEGPIGWDSVRQSVMDIWGLGSHSLPRTVWRLITHPGNLIGDYIDGRRQVSFPPVKMLFIVSVVVVFFIYYVLPFFTDANMYEMPDSVIPNFSTWNRGHFAWMYFGLSLLYILPTWVLFRYSPRHTRHTLPQCFFIQVFMLVLNLVVTTFMLFPFLFINYFVYISICLVVLVLYYVIAYKQLFGYGVWGTLWRVLLVIGVACYMVSSLMIVLLDFDFEALGYSGLNKYSMALQSVCFALLLLAIGWLINLIATRKARREIKASAIEKKASL